MARTKNRSNKTLPGNTQNALLPPHENQFLHIKRKRALGANHRSRKHIEPNTARTYLERAPATLRKSILARYKERGAGRQPHGRKNISLQTLPENIQNAFLLPYEHQLLHLERQRALGANHTDTKHIAPNIARKLSERAPATL